MPILMAIMSQFLKHASPGVLKNNCNIIPAAEGRKKYLQYGVEVGVGKRRENEENSTDNGI